MWWSRSSPHAPSSPEPGRVVDRRLIPPGVVPRHLQQWVLIGVAVVMVGIMALTGSPSRPRDTDPIAGQAPVVDPNQQRIEEYQRRIQEQAQRLAAEQAQLELAKEAVTTSVGGNPGVASVAADRRPSAEPRSVRSTREEQARFADNVAYSKTSAARADATVEPTDGLGLPGAPAPPQVAGLVARSVDVSASPSLAPVARTASTPDFARSLGDERRYRLYEGTVIDTVLTNRLDGTFSGPVNCLVSVPVYAADHQHLVIPAGSRVLGEARAVNAFGQSRLAVVFHRVLLPDGTSIDLNGFHGLNQVGDLGLQDQVDRHYGQIFGTSLAIGALAGFAQAQTSVGLDATGFDAYRQGAAANVSQSSMRVLDRFLNLLPTVTIREGHRIKVYLSNDLELPAYREAPRMTGGRP